MRNFVLGILGTLAVLAFGGLGLLLLGFFPSRANVAPPRIEMRIANTALDASIDRHAPHLNSPVPPTDYNLIDGMKLYTMNCALCHGGLDLKPSPLAKNFYPPPPQLILRGVDDPEWQVFFLTRTGIRYTAMPAWENVLTEPDMWKIAAFLTRTRKLPPAAKDFWQKSTGVAPPVGEGRGGDDTPGSSR